MKSFSMYFLLFLAARNEAHKFVPRIVGGERTTIEENPYQVSIRRYQQHICGGSVLNPSHILTGAHCIEGDRFKYSVWAGSDEVVDDAEGVVRKVAEIRVHPKYNVSTLYENDVAIMKVKPPFELSAKIQPIEMAIEDPPDGAMATVCGWGFTKYGDYRIQMYLLKVDIPMVSNEDCQKFYKSFTEESAKRKICAGEVGKDSCQADSGGALVYNKTQVGIVSYGKKCGTGTPGVYTRITGVRDWIMENSDF